MVITTAPHTVTLAPSLSLTRDTISNDSSNQAKGDIEPSRNFFFSLLIFKSQSSTSNNTKPVDRITFSSCVFALSFLFYERPVVC
jgi:hypothetical protein